jgi:mRNA interferase MazF
MILPSRGEVWFGDLDPTIGREQAGRRPVLIVSIDSFNQGPGQLVVAVPMTSRLRPISSHVRLSPPEGGLRMESSILCENVRSISTKRLLERWGVVSPRILTAVEARLAILLGFWSSR